MISTSKLNPEEPSPNLIAPARLAAGRPGRYVPNIIHRRLTVVIAELN
jgi:hypothetical protein